MQVILPFLSRFLVISGFLADTRPPLAKPASRVYLSAMSSSSLVSYIHSRQLSLHATRADGGRI
jgi:hypothetical protein